MGILGCALRPDLPLIAPPRRCVDVLATTLLAAREPSFAGLKWRCLNPERDVVVGQGVGGGKRVADSILQHVGEDVGLTVVSLEVAAAVPHS